MKKNNLKMLFKNKRVIYLGSVILLTLFSLALNIAFSEFTSRTTKNVANIRVNDMNYSIIINGSAGTIIKATANDITISNIILTSLNDIDSKYELIYKVCSDPGCTSYITKPDGFTVEYSSRTQDLINGTISADGAKSVRIIITNTTVSDIYIQIGVNAGYTHNTLELLELIATEYSEEDITIAAYIKGELSTSFPVTGEYATNVVCTVDGDETTATGVATWDGNKWKVDISNVTTGRTLCNVYFSEEYVTKPTTVVFTVHQDCKQTEGYANGSVVAGGTLAGYQYSNDKVNWSATMPPSTSVKLITYATNVSAPTGAGAWGDVYIRAVTNNNVYSEIYEWYGRLTVGCGAL